MLTQYHSFELILDHPYQGYAQCTSTSPHPSSFSIQRYARKSIGGTTRRRETYGQSSCQKYCAFSTLDLSTSYLQCYPHLQPVQCCPLQCCSLESSTRAPYARRESIYFSNQSKLGTLFHKEEGRCKAVGFVVYQFEDTTRR